MKSLLKTGGSVRREVQLPTTAVESKARLPSLCSHNFVIVVAHDLREPWGTMFLEGQSPTWIAEAKKKGIPVVEALSKPANSLWRAIDGIQLRLRWARATRNFFAVTASFLEKFAPRRAVQWSFSEESQVVTENSPSSQILMHRRNIAIFDWFVNYTNADFIFRVNSSSYIDVERLTKFMSSLDPEKEMVFGKICEFENRLRFLSGAGLIVSRPVAEKLLRDLSCIRRDLMEDVALGLAFDAVKATFVPIPRMDLDDGLTEHNVQSFVSSDVFHFRCKSPSRPDGEIRKMLLLHSSLGYEKM